MRPDGAVRPVTTGAVTRPAPLHEPRVRAVLLHHGGGSNLLYRGWSSHFPADWEVCLLDYPGRNGSRRAGELLGDCASLVEYLYAHVEPWCDRPFVLFGHSMGSIMVYELTRRILAEGGRLPDAVHVSAFPAPHRRVPVEPPPSQLADEDLRRWLREADGCPPRLLDSDVLWSRFGPVFRNDLGVIDTYPVPGPAEVTRLPVPLSVSGARDDVLATPDQMAAWEACTNDFRGLRLYPGGHFYLADHVREVVATITGADRV